MNLLDRWWLRRTVGLGIGSQECARQVAKLAAEYGYEDTRHFAREWWSVLTDEELQLCETAERAGGKTATGYIKGKHPPPEPAFDRLIT